MSESEVGTREAGRCPGAHGAASLAEATLTDPKTLARPNAFYKALRTELFASANDDEKEFPCPRNFDLNRGNIGRHLSFGAGVHRCIGLALARMEIKVAAREFVKRLDNIKLVIPVQEINSARMSERHRYCRRTELPGPGAAGARRWSAWARSK